MQKRQVKSETEFRALYDRQFARVYRLALLLVGSAADAEDVAQNVFVKAWEKQPRFRDSNHENAWFLTVARNQCRDLLKNSFFKKRAAFEETKEPQCVFASREDSMLWLALCELPGKYRITLYLYYYEGYSVRELSEMLHCKESTLQTRLSDGRKKLRAILEAEESDS